MTRLARDALMWLVAGVGFDISQRVLDHYLDAVVAATPWLAFLN